MVNDTCICIILEIPLLHIIKLKYCVMLAIMLQMMQLKYRPT